MTLVAASLGLILPVDAINVDEAILRNRIEETDHKLVRPQCTVIKFYESISLTVL